MGRQIQNAGTGIANVGKGLTTAVTLPIAGIAGAALKTSNDFENAMAKVGTIADTTTTPMKNLKEQVLGLSNDMGVGVSELAEAQYQAISAGIKTAESAGFVSTAVKAAKGGFTDTTTAVDGLTTVLNSYGLQASKAQEISDQMLMAQNYGKTSFGEMAGSMGKVIPIASSLNVSTEELFSSIAVLTKNGIGTSEAVTGLKAAYSNILKPSSEASKMAEKLGLNFSSAHLQSVGWAGFLEEIKDKTGGNAETMAKLFGSTEALNSVTVLAGKGSKDFNEALGLMGDSAGATQKAYEGMITPSERMSKAFNKIKNSLMQFGDALTPVFEKTAEIIGLVGDKLNGLSEEQVNSIMKFAGIAAAIGPAILVFGKIVKGVGGAVSMFSKITKVVANFGGIMGVITSPAGIVIGILAAIAVAGVLVYKNWDKVKAMAVKLGQTIKRVFLKSGIDVNKLKDTFLNMKANVQSAIENLKPVISKIIEFLKPVIKFMKDVFMAGVKITFSKIIGFISGFVDGATTYIDGIITAFKGVTQFLNGVFTGDWKKAFNGLKTFFKGWGEAVLGLLKMPINGFVGLVNGAIEAINNINIKIPDFVPGIGGKEFGGFNIPKLPMLYRGTNNWGGGPAMIHDRGAEIVDLPRGSRVYPHDKSIEMAKQEGAARGGFNITISKLADKIEVRSDEDIDRIAEALALKLKKVAFNV